MLVLEAYGDRWLSTKGGKKNVTQFVGYSWEYDFTFAML